VDRYQKPVAVLGAGNAGCCMAADLALQGYKINLYQSPRFEEDFRLIRDTKKIEISGSGKDGVARLEKATHDMKEALEGVELVNLTVPAFAQDYFFRELIPLLTDGHIVVLWAGNFGTLRLKKLLGEAKTSARPLIAEVNTMPYGTRIKAPGKVELPVIAPSFTVSALPAEKTGSVMNVLKEIYPAVREGSNVLSVAMSNPNPVIHPAGVLLNTGRIEYSGGDFGLYREGITPSVAKVIKDIYSEVVSLAGELGFQVIQYEERDFNTTTSVMGVAFQAERDTAGVIARNFPGPHSLDDRYVTEDIPYGLVPMSLMAKAYGIETPLIDAVISIGSAVCGKNYMETGRTLDTLGISSMDKGSLVEYVSTGKS